MQAPFSYTLSEATPVQCRSAAPCQLQVLDGTLWLTIEGDKYDYWLRRNEIFCIPAKQTFWLSAHPAAVFQCQITPRRSSLHALRQLMKGTCRQERFFQHSRDAIFHFLKCVLHLDSDEKPPSQRSHARQ